MSTCQTTRNQLSDHLDAPRPGELPEATRRHLESCADCASYRKEIEGLDARLSAPAPATAPAGLHAGIMAAVRAQGDLPEQKIIAFPRWLAPVALGAAAAIAAFLIVRGGDESPAQPPIADQPATEDIVIPEPGGLPSGFGVPMDVASLTAAVERGVSTSLGREADLILSDVGKVRDFFGSRLRRATGQGS